MAIASHLRRRWALGPIVSAPRTGVTGVRLRPTSTIGDAEIARMLDAAYKNTIDFDPDADHSQMLSTWRNYDGANDQASRVAVQAGQIVGVCLIGAELAHPFLYDVALLPETRRCGYAEAMLSEALGHLARCGESACNAWVTDGNTASERLLAGAGFVRVTKRRRLLAASPAAAGLRLVTRRAPAMV